jgi:nitroreductase
MAQPVNDQPLFDVMYTCRAMRRLKPDPVPEQLLLQLVEAAIHAPSSSNAQNWRFVIVRDRAQKARMADLWRKAWAFYRDTIAAAALRPGETVEMRKRAVAAGTYMVNHLADIPALICVGVKRDDLVAKVLQSPATLTAAARHFGLGGAAKLLMNAGRSSATGVASTAYPAVQNLLLAARALGLGAVLTTPHLFSPGEYERILDIPKNVTLAAVVPVGYPKGKFGPVTRAPAESFVSWDRYSGEPAG